MINDAVVIAGIRFCGCAVGVINNSSKLGQGQALLSVHWPTGCAESYCYCCFERSCSSGIRMQIK